MLGNDAVHEVEKLDAPPAATVAGLDQASGQVERGKQYLGEQHTGGYHFNTAQRFVHERGFGMVRGRSR
jgi:hypothetical protein